MELMMEENITNKELKQRELQLLIMFAEYCDAHDLCYVLGGGSLLGAIRHKGFIPWDDDIDLMMPRPDYQRFIELQKKESVFEFATVEDCSMNYPFLKIFDKSVTIDMDYVGDVGASYLWIDVFPIDGLPEDDRVNCRIFKISLFLRKLLLIANAKVGNGTNFVRTVGKIPIHFILKLLGPYRLAQWIDAFCQRYSFDEEKYVGGIAWGYGPQERMPRQEWMTRTKVEFEQHLFWAPGCWDYYLTQLYGDYMKLPPENQRVAHHMQIQFKEM